MSKDDWNISPKDPAQVKPEAIHGACNASDAESENEEGRPIKGQKTIYRPGKQEWDDHMRSHIPFRRLCPFCIKGKAFGRSLVE